MAVHAYYVTHDLAAHHKFAVVLLDDEVPAEYGLIQSGYVEQLRTPEVTNAAEGPHRAG